MASPFAFRAVVWFHILFAVVLAAHSLWLARDVFRQRRALPELTGPAVALVLLLVCQFGLGAATWVLKYGWPAWFSDLTMAAQHTVRANSMAQATVVTAHVAVGSLILATSVLVSVRSFRLLRAEAAAVGSGTLLMGVAS